VPPPWRYISYTSSPSSSEEEPFPVYKASSPGVVDAKA
jgi:hypothetical protein